LGVFGRRRREESEELLRETRERLDASAWQSARLADTLSALNVTISAELARTEQLEAAADATASALQQALSAQSTDVATALEHVASMYATLTQRIEADRVERHTFTEAIRQLAGPPALAEPERPRVLGGSVFAMPASESSSNGASANGGDDRVDLVTEIPYDIGTAVSCRFGDQWIDGVEIVEVIGEPNQITYRLRRRQDGYVLPPLFGSSDLRAAPRVSNGTPANGDGVFRSRWARS
jgi:hypothetical protein